MLVAGPVAAALAGAGAGGATGVLLGALMGAGVPKHEVNAFESALNKKKGMVLGVSIENGDDRREDIKRIMKDNVGKGVLVQQPLGVSEIAGRKFA